MMKDDKSGMSPFFSLVFVGMVLNSVGFVLIEDPRWLKYTVMIFSLCILMFGAIMQLKHAANLKKEVESKNRSDSETG